MTTIKCVHHWIIESPNGPYSLAKCKKCGEYDAMLNALPENGWSAYASPKQISTQEDIERRMFLRKKIKENEEKIKEERIKKETVKQKPLKTKLIRKAPIQYTDIVKIRVLRDLIKGRAISETSRIYKVPTSTIHGWRKTYSSYPKVKTSGSIEILKKVLIEKIKIDNNVSNIAKDYNMPRRTLRDWIKKQAA